MRWPLAILAATAIVFNSGQQAIANDYSLAANLVMRNRGRYIPWRISIFLIDHFIDHSDRSSERAAAVRSLIWHHDSPSLALHLKRYSEDSDQSVRIATFWPLYRNGEKQYAMALLRRELAAKNRSVLNVFHLPNQVGSDLEIELVRSDPEFYQFLEKTATDKSQDSWFRLYAAIHLFQIDSKKEEFASTLAKEILATIPPDPQLKDHNSWPREAQMRFHLRAHPTTST